MRSFLLIPILAMLSTTLHAQPWQVRPDIPIDLAFPVVVELRGNIHVIGGGGPAGASDLHLRYSPTTNLWDTLPPVPYLAQQAAGATVNDKIHFCGGGYPTSGQRLDHHYYYDPDSVQWFQVAPMPVATAIHKAVAFDGKFYVLSGQPDKYLCEYYDPATNSWVQKNALPDQNFWYGAIVSSPDAIFRFGGGAYFGPSDAAHRYDPVNDTWIPIPSLPQPLHAPAGTNLNNTHIFISGGYFNGAIDEVLAYDILNQVYYLSDPLPDANNYHSMVTIGNCIYSVGGYNQAVPNIAVALLENCGPVIYTSLQEATQSPDKPYSTLITPDEFTVHLLATHTGTSLAVSVYDISGRLVKHQKAAAFSNEIHLNNSQMQPGRYVISIQVGEQMFTESWTTIK